MDVKERILTAGVNALKEYGYPEVNKQNILNDTIYQAFFKEMLDGTIRQTEVNGEEEIKKACLEILKEMGGKDGTES